MYTMSLFIPNIVEDIFIQDFIGVSYSVAE